MSQYRDDSRELADGVARDIEGVLSKYWRGWITEQRKGKLVALVTPRVKRDSKSKRQTSSFTVQLDGGDRGKWYRFSQGVGGHALQLLFYAENDRLAVSKEDWAEAYRLAREFLGITREREVSAEEEAARKARREATDRERERQCAAAAAEAQMDKVRRADTAASIWSECRPLRGSHGDAYLQARGIPPVAEWKWDPGETIRFHPSLRYPDHGNFPAVVARVQDAWGGTVAIWRVFLANDAPKKADVPDAKLGLGPAAGGAVRIGGDAEDIGGAEGIESALGAYFLEDARRPVWAFLSTSGMAGFEPPLFIKKVRLWQDSDYGKVNKTTGAVMEPPGIEAARALRARLIPTGIKCVIQPGQVHGDALDLLIAKREYEKSHQSV